MERLEHRLLGLVAKASETWKLLEEGDRVMVCLSGGKDSYVMAHLLRQIQRKAPFRFELVLAHLDQGQPGFPGHILEAWMAEQGLEWHIFREPTYEIVKEKTAPGKAYCSMCSRLRRGILYNRAVELGVTKIALGHHRDDAIETLMLNGMFAGQLKAMPARLRSDDGRNTVIRPLILCAEADIARLAVELAFPILPCTLCSQQPDLMRARVKRLLDDLDAELPGVRRNLATAIGNVRPSHLLDLALHDGIDVVGAEDALAAVDGGGGCAAS